MIRKLLNREIVLYIIVGILTTAVDYAVFAIVNESMKRAGSAVPDPVMTATVVSWIAAVLFAYIANKLAVFNNYNFAPGHVIREMSTFVGARVISGLVVLLLMWLLTSKLGVNEYISKLLTSVFNIIFNYAASKFFIFKK